MMPATLESTAALDAVRRIEETCRKAGMPVERTEIGFVYRSPAGPTFVSVWPPDDPKGDVCNVIRVDSPLEITSDGHLDQSLNVLNTMALMGAVARTEDNCVSILSTVPVRRGYESQLALDEELLLCAIHTHQVAVTRSIGYVFQDVKDFDPLPKGDESGAWTAEEFAAVSNALRCVSLASGRALSAEIPWVEGAVSAATGDETALVSLSVEQHPVCGTGLMYRLQLPMQLEPEELADTCRVLNLAEFQNDTAPPLLGAWCAGPGQTPTFVGFLPNLVYQRQLVHRAATWLWWRSDWARQLLASDGDDAES